MDEDLQALVRTWAATQTLEDGVRAARARLRAGLLPEHHGRLAATLGDPIARALGFLPDAPGWPPPRLRTVLIRGPQDDMRGILRCAAERILGAAVGMPANDVGTAAHDDLMQVLAELNAERDRRVVASWTGDEESLRRALSATARRDHEWLERRLAMTLLFGPGLLPPVEPWTPPAPPRPPRPRPLMGP